MMRRITLVFLLLLGLQTNAATLLARVDRTTLSLDETVELTLETADGTAFGKPDLQPLDSLFKVSGTRQNNQLAGANGEAQAITQWQVTLQPLQTGYVVIPPLQLGDARSEPITLHVTEPSASDSDLLAPIFIDASLDQELAYVQAQVLLTLRIYHSVSLYDDSTLSPLQMNDALVERLGEPRTYEKDINGVRHGVIEIRYALFPQKSGELTIPAQVFSATAVAPSTGDQYGSRFGRATQVKSPTIPLVVKPKPADYPADAAWLPARSLTLVEAWSPEPADAQLGEALTRSVLLKADGLTSSQLPPITSPKVSGLRSYPDQPTLNNEVTANGVSGSREQREALVATRAGDFQLPPVEVVWWNTVDDHLERSTLPGRNLLVADNPDLLQPAIDTPQIPEQREARRLWPWQLSSALLALTTLLGFGLWLHARSQPAVIRTVPTGPTPRSLLDDLKRACLANDTLATRHALDAWARQQPETLADMAARFEPLSDALDGLNGALYSETGQRWQGEALWQAIQSLPAGQAGDVEREASALPPLYPR
ncbi:BatD family protein [Stutzerimonas xanthomarina]|uniref:Oxygen tolerance n=2 Tax=Stutzerimonas xanthomarina TaxID=271420 RepID=A0A1M5RVA2_9GAMM|nr:BatD family protein [Stutzerimonas xanthomarina]MCP9339334.1 BatD family protein [Stutzerimonas xanthomarina]SEH93714.1 Oxygen tolerance [Stutzerimonas xanthomarina]SHH30225.1 Oxygen tolerance [Stutzerimonas xanthomarina DSM 18231]